ncbi:MAG: DUF4267 domain-containing protein [Anaerolineales bacterium]|nr:DUF4267 domain-containing protein [Anaerolineales bacterium]
MSPAAKLVPTWVRIIAGLVALLNLAYGLSGYFAPADILPGLSADTAASLNAAYIFSARNVAIGIALGIVSLRGVPESIAIVMIIRFLVEAQDLVLSIIAGNPLTALLMPIVFIAVELTIIVTMFKIVGERDTH